MKLSEHFSLEEFTRSQTATRMCIENTPSDKLIENGVALCENVLEPLRLAIGKPITITSGYRCRNLNRLIGGSATSSHMKFEAADIVVYGLETGGIAAKINQLGLEYDQLINEFGSWVHVSYSMGDNRRESLIAKKVAGRTVYEHS